MTQVSRPRRPLTTPAVPQPRPSRQLCMTFEIPALQGLAASERSNVVAHLATVLLQAAGVQAREDDDE